LIRNTHREMATATQMINIQRKTKPMAPIKTPF